MKNLTIRERLVKIETLLAHHLKHHEQITIVILAPILVGVILLLLRAYIF